MAEIKLNVSYTEVIKLQPRLTKITPENDKK